MNSSVVINVINLFAYNVWKKIKHNLEMFAHIVNRNFIKTDTIHCVFNEYFFNVIFIILFL